MKGTAMLQPRTSPRNSAVLAGCAVFWALVGPVSTSRAAEEPAETTVKNDDKMVEARKQFQAGVNLLEDPEGAQYEQAYNAFRKAFELSRSPKVLGNIGFCALHLERDGEAIDAYTTYLRDAPDISERERVQIQKDLVTLTSTVSQMRVAAVKHAGGPFTLVDTRVQTSGPPIVNSYPFEGNGDLQLRVRPGRHVLKVAGKGIESLPVEAFVSPAAQVNYEFAFPAPEPPREPVAALPPKPRSYVGPIVLGIGGGVLLGAGTVFGIIAKSKTNAIAEKCPNDLCPATYDLNGARQTARTYGNLADVGFIAGGAVAASAILWALFTPKPAPAQTAVAWAPSAACGPNGCSVQLERSF
jgi:hypothetical protein